MNEIIACPTCQRKVQLPEELLGKTVQCPECQQAFLAEAFTQAPPAPLAPLAPPAPPAPRPLATVGRGRYNDEIEPEEPFDDWSYRRHGLRADRGGMILAFGIMSVVLGCLGVVFGPLAWFFGSSDLAAIDRGEMDPTNRSLVQAGRIIGAVGFVIGALNLLLVVGYFLFLFAVIRG